MSQLSTLLKMQMSSIGSSFVRRGKKGNKKDSAKHSVGRIVGMTLLYLYLIVIFVFLFAMSFSQLAPVYGALDLGWLYFAMSFITMSLIMLIGSVFLAKGMLFEAKDNELLLSMPIPPRTILVSRMLSLYIMNLVYGFTVALPAICCWYFFNGITALTVIFGIILYFAAALFVLGISSLLGWGLSRISGYIKNKTLITVVCSLAAIGIYYYFVGAGAEKMMAMLLENGEAIASKMGVFLPLYWYGHAVADGNVLSFLEMLAVLIGIFALVFFLLAKTFYSTATTSRGFRKEVYHAGAMKTSSPIAAMLRRENTRLLSNATYLLNAGLGLVMLVAAGVMLLVKRDLVTELLPMLEDTSMAAVLAVLAGCLVSSMILFTPPSVSLEGQTLWILRSMPVRAWDVLMAKFLLHVTWASVPTLFFSAVAAAVFGGNAVMMIGMVLTLIMFMLAIGALGLVFGLRFANFQFISEAHAVKQSIAVLLIMLAGSVLTIIPGVLWFLLELPTTVFLYGYAALLTIIFVCSMVWLHSAGVKKFDSFAA